MTHPLVKFGDVVHLNTSRLADPAAAVILFLHFWKWIIIAALVAMGIFLMYQRLRELTG
jgi:hypothetical protein